MFKCIELYFIYIFVFALILLHYNYSIISRNSFLQRTDRKVLYQINKMLNTERISTSFLEKTFIYNVEKDKFKLKKLIVFKNKEKKLNK